MTKWIVSAPLKGTDLMKNFVCFTEVELQKLLEQYPEAMVEMKDSHLEDYPEMKDYSLISTAQTENYIQVNDTRYTLDEFNRVGDFLLGRGLTDDQQVVLDWLKQYREEQGENPLNTVSTLIDMYCADPAGGEVPLPSNVKEAYKKLNDEQEFQVLAAFAEWGLSTLDN